MSREDDLYLSKYRASRLVEAAAASLRLAGISATNEDFDDALKWVRSASEDALRAEQALQLAKVAFAMAASVAASPDVTGGFVP